MHSLRKTGIPKCNKIYTEFQPHVKLWFPHVFWSVCLHYLCFRNGSLQFIHNLQIKEGYFQLQSVPDVGDGGPCSELPGYTHHVCLLLYRQCGVQRTVWLPDPGQALPVLLKLWQSPKSETRHTGNWPSSFGRNFLHQFQRNTGSFLDLYFSMVGVGYFWNCPI